MTINFENYGHFYAFACDEDETYNYKCEDGYTLRECASWCEEIMTIHPLERACICDNLTGEVVATITYENEDEEEENWDDDFRDDWGDEIGFNPYEGCYDYDC